VIARINISSVSSQVSAAQLADLARQAPSVGVFSMIDRREVGRVISYDWQPPDLWADIELQDDASMVDGMRAAAAICRDECDGKVTVTLGGVMLTTLPRELIRTLGSGLSYADAVAKLTADRKRPS
jgi:hypothetical protein